MEANLIKKMLCSCRSKITNKTQIQHLVTIMEANPGIVCGFYKGNKDTLARFWKNAEIDLNSMGSPSKCAGVGRPKKQNEIGKIKSTGGGLNKENTFSPTEEYRT